MSDEGQCQRVDLVRVLDRELRRVTQERDEARRELQLLREELEVDLVPERHWWTVVFEAEAGGRYSTGNRLVRVQVPADFEGAAIREVERQFGHLYRSLKVKVVLDEGLRRWER